MSRIVRRSRATGNRQHLSELFTVFSHIDRRRRRAKNRHTRSLKITRKRQRSLTTQLNNDTLDRTGRAFCPIDLEHILKRQGLKIEAIRNIVVSRHGFWVAVHHDRVVALAQAHRCVHARIIELNALTDTIRPSTQNDDCFALAGRNLVLEVVARVVIRSLRRKLCRARIHRLKDGVNLESTSYFSHARLRQASNITNLTVGEAVTFRKTQYLAIKRGSLSDFTSNLVKQVELVKEPGVDLRRIEELVERRTSTDCVHDLHKALFGASCSLSDKCFCLFCGGTRPRPRELNSRLVNGAQRFLKRLREVAPDCHGLADCFH
ncbi:Uncharacterised protein [Chlamydia trachomatis]|nr:Uncharacterised protein [Chlamydia trachomatis]